MTARPDRRAAATDALRDALESALDPSAVLWSPSEADVAGGWSRLGRPLALVRPRTTEEVAAIVRACAAAATPVVPWGGRTGLVSGACADDAVAVSLERMNAIEEVDPIDGTMLVQAGCVLATVCEAAEAQGLSFPLDLGARGSATIGGNIATNAGGNRVLRFGMMRELLLGLEVVLADGSVLSGLNPHVKNNTGYDLKHLFVGSEGTLGIVTRARLRLRPALPSHQVALVAAEQFDAVAKLLRFLESRLGGQLSAFEAMWDDYYALVTTPPARGRPILPHGRPYYVLVESMGGDPEGDADRFARTLSDATDQGLVADAVVAQSRAEAEEIWAVRDDGEQVGRIGPYVALDVSLRVSRIEGFVAALRASLEARWPGTRIVVFGHVGDGNIHVIVSVDPDTSAQRELVTRTVLELASGHGASISAEHGIGLDKRPYLSLTRSEDEIRAMWRVKRALDPNDLMNPGKTLPPSLAPGPVAR